METMQTAYPTTLAPWLLASISWKCSYAFHSRLERKHDLKHAGIMSPNSFTVYFKLDGRLWLWQQIVPDASTDLHLLFKKIRNGWPNTPAEPKIFLARMERVPSGSLLCILQQPSINNISE